MYLNDEAYTKALELALEGEKKDKDLGGLVDNWKAYKYQAYKGLGQVEEQLKWLRNYF